jgi:hypothetical protein
MRVLLLLSALLLIVGDAKPQVMRSGAVSNQTDLATRRDESSLPKRAANTSASGVCRTSGSLIGQYTVPEIETSDEPGLKSKSAHVPSGEKFHWKRALTESAIFLGIQHGYRLAVQKYTREQLKGPFFRDWAVTVKSLHGWRDGNSNFTNYVAHPLQGSLTGRIFVANSDRSRSLTFGRSKEYWNSRLKALAWSAAWSTQFELGPVSEANIGNVGLHPDRGGSSMAYVDLVVTPVLGTGILIGEDAVDRFLQKRVESHGRSRMSIKILRSVLTPTTTIENLLHAKPPWHRANRR